MRWENPKAHSKKSKKSKIKNNKLNQPARACSKPRANSEASGKKISPRKSRTPGADVSGKKLKGSGAKKPPAVAKKRPSRAKTWAAVPTKAEQLALARRLMAGNVPEVSLVESQRRAHVLAVIGEFERQLRVYRDAPYVGVKAAHRQPGTKEFAKWERVTALVEQSGVGAAQYVKAHFFWFDRWFNRAPRSYELGQREGKCPSLERVRLYQHEVSQGAVQATRDVSGPVSRTSTVPAEVKHANSERQLAQLMGAYDLDAESVLRMFSDNGDASAYFDRGWLRAHPVWQKIKQEGAR